jgi:hypothetical protein
VLTQVQDNNVCGPGGERHEPSHVEAFTDFSTHEQFSRSLHLIFSLLLATSPLIQLTSVVIRDFQRQLKTAVGHRDNGVHTLFNTHLPVSKVKYVLESSDEDEQLAAIIFMKDMNEARAIVATEWALFKDGQSAYTTAAEIEDAATSIYFRLHTEFTENNPTLLRHRDLLVLLRPQPKPASTNMSVTSHTELTLYCERVATILEHCFTKPLEMVADVKLTVNPLEFLDDATLGLNHAEKMWLHTLSCL